MIGWLSGRLKERSPPTLLIDVNGVGYEVEAPMTTFYSLPETGADLTLFIHHVVREDASLLYGFVRESDRRLFRTLIRVNGVGPKMALGILSGMDANQFAACIQAEDTASLIRLPGVGKKTAERLVVEMRDKLETSGASVSGVVSAETEQVHEPRQEAISALIALGYGAAEAGRRVNQVATGDIGCEDIIRLALQSGTR